jgi:NAD+--asparagine ADP-ribosyltransferase
VHARIELLAEVDIITDLDLLGMEKAEISGVVTDPRCLNKATPLRTPEDKKERDKEYSKVYHQDHRDHNREKIRQWRLDNPEKYAEQCRRAKERAREKRAGQKTI